MNIEMTRYLKSVLLESVHPVVPFKDGDFVSLSYEQLLKGEFYIEKSNPLCELLKSVEYKKLFEELPEDEKNKNQALQMNCIVSYKTLKTEFFEQDRVKEYIPELTGIYYFPFTVDFLRDSETVKVKFIFDKNNLPWYARDFISPNFMNKLPIVASVESVNKYESDTTEHRAKIETWQDYVNYCDGLFNATANCSLKYEENCYIFRTDIDKKNITKPIVDLYESLENETEHKLYDNFINLNLKETRSLVADDTETAKLHCGQMNGEFCLADSQREAINHMNAIYDGEILAVSGPPGTGKTTLLQSVVADMVVKSALKGDAPPIIVATSANNQAVTNIIDSFSSIKAVRISNLEQRWIDGVKSFATYMPSSTKEEDAQKKGYQYTTFRNYGFIDEIEDKIDTNIKMIKECADEYFGKEFISISEIKTELQRELNLIDALRCDLILLSHDIVNFTGGKDLIEFVDELKKLRNDSENDKDKLEIRHSEWEKAKESISIIKRMLSFVPYFKKKIANQIVITASSEEISLIDDKTTFDKIINWYNDKIKSEKIKINDFDNKIKKAEDYVSQVENILTKLRSKNCCLSLLNGDSLIKFEPSNINNLLDTKIRYVEFWLAVHINECRFLEGEYRATEKQKTATYKNIIEKFYRQIALVSPCFVMTAFKMPSHFKSAEGYLFDYIDLLIFDEAGQCSPEIAAADFSLAKKAIVVGDECQIPPVYNLDSLMDITLAIQNEIINDENDFETLVECGLSCSQGSVMKAAKKSCSYNSNEKIRGMFLCEHRRCYNEIIEYCNELVYNGLLRPLRNADGRVLDSEKYPFMGCHNVPGSKSNMQGSSRINENDALEIAKWVKENYDKICGFYQKQKADVDIRNILAIITPFKAQVAIIRKHLKAEMGDKASNISVGTVHTFQGAERNIIIFSTVYDSGDKGAFIDNNRNLMNVAVSRAKDAFWVFGDIDFLKKKSPNSASGLLYKKIVGDFID